MFMDRRERRLSNRNGTTPEYTNGKFRDDKNGYGGGFFFDPSSSNILRIPSPTSSSPPPRSSSPDRGYIEHRVSKFDTLAGVAIKYGVEVGDVKKMNGLVTDLQMFALKEGCSCHELEPQNDTNSDAFDSFQSLRLKSSKKKGYYGLKPPIRTVSVGGSLEMGAYKTESNGDSQYLRPFPSTNTPLNHHRKSRSLVNALLEEFNQSSQEPSSTKFMRRRQKSEADFTSRTPELMLKEESTSSSNGGFLSSVGGKGLALRSKASSRTSLSSAESETWSFNPVPMNLMDALVSDSFASVRKSSSASSLQDPDGNSNNGSSSLSLWSTSTPAAITSSIFDGLPKPLTGRRNKTAMD
ncbi:unnamed protein product [Brassica rapa subsp. narinosa]